MDENKRRFTRIPLEIPTSLYVADGTRHAAGTFENLSIGGCLLSIETPPPIGKTCLLEIVLGEGDDNTTITVSGVIVRSESGLVGIKFDSIDPDSLFLLQNIVRYNAEDPDLIEDEINKHPGIV